MLEPSLYARAMALALALALGSLAAGLVLALTKWLKAPSHPRFALAPAPLTRLGVALRLVREAVMFESLYRASPVTWLLGWPMHVALALIGVQHLRYFVPGWSVAVERVAAFGHLASAVLAVTLIGLWMRRLLVVRIRYVSRPSDHAWLALLLALVVTGALLKYRMPADTVAVKAFVQGVLTFEHRPLPAHAVLFAHLAAAFVLIGLFPFSKLLHGVAVWVNPTRASRGPLPR